MNKKIDLEKIWIIEKYSSTNKDKKDERLIVLRNAKKNLMEEKRSLRHLKKVFFQCLKNQTEKQDEKQVEEKEKKRKADLKKFGDKIIKEQTKDIDRTISKYNFSHQSATAMLKNLIDTDRKINTDLAGSIRKKLSDFMDNFLNVSEKEEANNNRLGTTLEVVAEILEFNKKYHNQEVQGLKILTPQQMLSRLPSFLAQLKAGNNSEKLKNGARQLLYSLYKSRKLSKTIYKHLMNAI